MLNISIYKILLDFLYLICERFCINYSRQYKKRLLYGSTTYLWHSLIVYRYCIAITTPVSPTLQSTFNTSFSEWTVQSMQQLSEFNLDTILADHCDKLSLLMQNSWLCLWKTKQKIHLLRNDIVWSSNCSLHVLHSP